MSEARRLRIGINALYLLPGQVGGTEIYLRCLLRAMANAGTDHHHVVFLNRESADVGIAPDHPTVTSVVCPVQATHRPARILWEQFRLPAECRCHKIDVLLNPGFTSPVAGTGCATVTVFHDLQFRKHPEFFSKPDLLAWRLLCGASARFSTGIVCSSPATTTDFLHFYSRPAAQVTTAPLAVDDRFFDLEWMPASENPYLLTVSTLHPHKNLERLLGAFQRFRKTEPATRLVIAGLKGFAAESVEARLRDLGLRDHVEITGWIERERLYSLYTAARAFVYPSLFEGFGMPVLEAMAVGIPTACADISPLREMVGAGALLLDPQSEASIESAIRSIWSDQTVRERLNRSGRQVASGFRWSSTAALTLDALQKAVERVSPRAS